VSASCTPARLNASTGTPFEELLVTDLMSLFGKKSLEASSGQKRVCGIIISGKEQARKRRIS
jgi:hypothetical protein